MPTMEYLLYPISATVSMERGLSRLIKSISSLSLPFRLRPPKPPLVEGSMSSGSSTPQNTRQFDRKVRGLQNRLNRKQQLSIAHIQHLGKAAQLTMQTKVAFTARNQGFTGRKRAATSKNGSKVCSNTYDCILNVQKGEDCVQQLDTQFNRQSE